ncbi:MAG: hypothetical protein JWN11_1865 [Hyphomicrobiales bacterium]|nr:hypothetical protein [Hyphomicrobiales bacterium]
MNKLISIAGAAALAIAVSATSATPSMADPAADAIGAGIVGGMFGFIAGSALADAPHRRVYVHDNYDYADYGPGYYDSRAHIRACLRAYRSYDVDSDTYVGYDGYSHQCDL